MSYSFTMLTERNNGSIVDDFITGNNLFYSRNLYGTVRLYVPISPTLYAKFDVQASENPVVSWRGSIEAHEIKKDYLNENLMLLRSCQIDWCRKDIWDEFQLVAETFHAFLDAYFGANAPNPKELSEMNEQISESVLLYQRRLEEFAAEFFNEYIAREGFQLDVYGYVVYNDAPNIVTNRRKRTRKNTDNSGNITFFDLWHEDKTQRFLEEIVE